MRLLALSVVFAFTTSASAQVPLTPVWTGVGDSPFGAYGIAVAGGGDLNGDGRPDIVVSEPYRSWSDAGPQFGKVHFYYGGPSGPGAVADTYVLDPIDGGGLGNSIAEGDFNGDGFQDVAVSRDSFYNTVIYFGGPGGLSLTPGWQVTPGGTYERTVACAGDVNGDGIDDLLIAQSTMSEPNYYQEGRVLLYLGGSPAPATTPSWSFEPNRERTGLGNSVAGVGDVDHDGYDDVVIGASLFDGSQTDEGRVYFFRGGPTGLRSTPALTIDGTQAYEHFGTSVAAAGDVNGDGFADVIVGAPLWDGAQANVGHAWIYLGSASGLSSVPSWSVEPSQTESSFGDTVAGIGDFNRDGYVDVAVGASDYDDGWIDSGEVFIYCGGPSGPATVPCYRLPGVNPGQNSPSGFGMAIAAVGDVDGDGWPEIVVGARFVNQAFAYSLHTSPATSVPADGSGTLTVALVRNDPYPGELHLAWGPSCGGEDDYAVYQGTLGSFTSHVPIACGTGHLSEYEIYSIPAENVYYLIAPLRLGTEGSLGSLAQGATTCRTVSIASCP